MVDDDDSGVLTAGAIVTVTVNLRRRAIEELYENQPISLDYRPEVPAAVEEEPSVSRLLFLHSVTNLYYLIKQRETIIFKVGLRSRN